MLPAVSSCSSLMSNQCWCDDSCVRIDIMKNEFTYVIYTFNWVTLAAGLSISLFHQSLLYPMLWCYIRKKVSLSKYLLFRMFLKQTEECVKWGRNLRKQGCYLHMSPVHIHQKWLSVWSRHPGLVSCSTESMTFTYKCMAKGIMHISN